MGLVMAEKKDMPSDLQTLAGIHLSTQTTSSMCRRKVGTYPLLNLHILSNLMYGHFVHQPLVYGAHILKFERHHLVAKETLTSYK